MKTNHVFVKWGLFVLLSFIWGSSFLLMLIGLEQLNAWQVAALRLFSAGIIMLPFAWPVIKRIPKEKVSYTILSGFLGSFFPAFLFCLAETRLDSSFAGTLNSLTPIFVILVGVFFFNLKVKWQQVIGILISFAGSIFLFMAKSGKTGDLLYVGFIVLGTFCYGLNVNMIGKKLRDIPSFDIGVLAFSFLAIPSLIILLAFGTHNLNFSDGHILWSLGASAILGIMGTTVASILFYVLLKRSGGIFASTVTYGIPFVAIFWGWVYHEKITVPVILSLLMILLGIFIINANEKPIRWLKGLLKKETRIKKITPP
ncbi:MAG: DMT family transporter [Sphingobacteriales bacterium]|nr:DMT family transporter [Sphingobacteriales bacterium]